MMEKIKVVTKTGFVSQLVGSVTRRQILNVSEPVAEHLRGLGLVEYVKKSATAVTEETAQGSATTDGQGEQSASLPVEIASVTTTLALPKNGRGRAGKR